MYLFLGANSNLRDYSGKKPKQYLKHSASSRAHRKISGIQSPVIDQLDLSGYDTLHDVTVTNTNSNTCRPSITITHLTLDHHVEKGASHA